MAEKFNAFVGDRPQDLIFEQSDAGGPEKKELLSAAGVVAVSPNLEGPKGP